MVPVPPESRRDGHGLLRLHDNAHWFSDTVAGAAIGVASEYFFEQPALGAP
jgi:hypothetical protein